MHDVLQMHRSLPEAGYDASGKDMFATEKDGTVNEDYCKWCYKDGEFIDQCSMEEYIEKCSQFGEQAGMTNEQMKEYCTKVFPTLKRWKK